MGNLIIQSTPRTGRDIVPHQIFLSEINCASQSECRGNRHRYYDPMQGRYITQDPIGLRGIF
ncbi:hypothetical protein BV494_15195 [Rahnella sikkimica]|uniref:Uncharacterized protein n=1 Tax=Rahnella sikkimica TaxID=1805933 RepID=A0A2L1UTB9_9GAMM|nr:hypothetical protein BV494_15195 [Rahnella sikkimica]